MIHPKMLGAFPKPKPQDMVEIMNGPHAGMIGRLRCIKDGRGRVDGCFVWGHVSHSAHTSFGPPSLDRLDGP